MNMVEVTTAEVTTLWIWLAGSIPREVPFFDQEEFGGFAKKLAVAAHGCLVWEIYFSLQIFLYDNFFLPKSLTKKIIFFQRGVA